MLTDLIHDRRAWRGDDFADKRAVTVMLSQGQVIALKDVTDALLTLSTQPWTLSPQHFRHPVLEKALSPVYEEIRDGRGFVIIRGLPLDEYDLNGIRLLYWGLGTYFGKGQSQSNLGDQIGEVTDVTPQDPHARGYRSSRALKHHTDICDMIGLLSVRTAKSGGASSLASALTIHNILLQERPDLLARLYEGYYYHRRGEQAPDEAPITPHKVPVFSWKHGVLNFRFVRSYMDYALKLQGETDPELTEAFDLIEHLADRTRFTFELESGEALFFSNLTTLHARTAFEDWPEADRRRLLYRLWLRNPDFRPQAAELNVYGIGDGIPHVPGRTASFANFY